MLGRHRYRVPENQRISFGTYFNGFAASYWRRGPSSTTVTLHVRLTGADATRDRLPLDAQRPLAARRLRDHRRATDTEDFRFDLPLDAVRRRRLVLVRHRRRPRRRGPRGGRPGSPTCPRTGPSPARVTIGITTMNRPDFCAKLLAQIGSRRRRARGPRRGHRRRAGHQEGRRRRRTSPAAAGGAAAASCGSSSRATWAAPAATPASQFETLEAGRSTYMMCMDDDVVCEPESIVRAVTFGDLCRRPTIVGGHMFSLYSKSRLHSFGEIINQYRFWWQSPPHGRDRLGLRGPQPAQRALAAPPHRRGLQRLVHVPDPDRGAARRSG